MAKKNEDPMKPGVDTTEYTEAKSAGKWALVMQIIGLLITIGSSVAQALGSEATAGIIVGAVVAALALFKETVVKLGYINSRTSVKVGAEK
jgi:hypothetical protein